MKPLKVNEPGDEVSVVGQWDGGFSWMAHPEETMRRASHAIVVDGDLWLVDPIDADGLDDNLTDLGEVAGVVVLTNSHGRHADLLAVRHDVAIHVPACFDLDTHPVTGFEAPVEIIEGDLANTGFQLVWQKDSRGWKEGALYHSDRGTLVMADTLMTALFTGKDGRLEVIPFFKRSPPRAELGNLAVERILVGHGEPVMEDAQQALLAALDGAGSPTPMAIVRCLPTLARQVYAEIRS